MNANTALKINDAIDQAIRCGESVEDVKAQVQRALNSAALDKAMTLLGDLKDAGAIESWSLRFPERGA